MALCQSINQRFGNLSPLLSAESFLMGSFNGCVKYPPVSGLNPAFGSGRITNQDFFAIHFFSCPHIGGFRSKRRLVSTLFGRWICCGRVEWFGMQVVCPIHNNPIAIVLELKIVKIQQIYFKCNICRWWPIHNCNSFETGDFSIPSYTLFKYDKCILLYSPWWSLWTVAQ